MFLARCPFLASFKFEARSRRQNWQAHGVRLLLAQSGSTLVAQIGHQPVPEMRLAFIQPITAGGP